MLVTDDINCFIAIAEANPPAYPVLILVVQWVVRIYSALLLLLLLLLLPFYSHYTGELALASTPEMN